MYLCCVSSLSPFRSKLDFLRIFKVTPKSGKKIRKKSNFDRNQLKLETQHKYMYMYQENYKNGEFSTFRFW